MSIVGVQSPAAPLVDRFGRVARDLRISLTDRCNLRCTYCMPAEGLPWLPSPDVLTDAEVVRLARIAAERLGVRAIRFTGGEPLLRRSLEQIVAEVAAIPAIEDIALTTNGLGLAKRAQALATAGLNRVNISLDALSPERYAAITRRDRLPDVLEAIEASKAAGLGPVKINTVLMRGVNESEAVPLARYCLEQGLELRFIEQMPLGPRHSWDRQDLVTAREIRELLAEEFEVLPAQREDPHAPASRWLIRSAEGGEPRAIGIIASVTEPFCGACDRTRLTADGQMRTCLFARAETDLRGPLRDGASDEDIAALWAGAQWEKKPGHGIDDPGFLQPQRGMSAIGG